MRHRQERRGAIIVLVAALLIVFLAMVVLSVDVAYMHLTRTRLRIATDAAARAGGEALSRLQDTALARQAAQGIAAENLVANSPLLLADEDVVFGNSTREPGGAWLFTAGGTPINSLQVMGRRTSDSPSGAVNTFLGKLFGRSTFEPVQSASVVVLDRDICLVVDRSSSMKLDMASTAETMSTSDPRFPLPPNMADSRWASLSGAVDEFIAALATTPQVEKLGLVSYSSEGTWAGVANNAADIDQSLDLNHTQVKTALDEITARVFNGATNISAGIDFGVDVLTDAATARPYASKTMVLLTDGCFNNGRPPIEAALDAAAQGIVIHTVTFSAGARQQDMIDVAEATGGEHYHADDAATLREVFRKIALTMPVVMTH
jgi:hypothetical protein